MKTLSFLVVLTGLCVVHAGFFDSLKKTFQSMFTPSPRVEEIKLSADDVSASIRTAKSLIVSQEFDKAVNLLLPLIDNDPDDKDANMLLGSTFLALNRADLAETFLHHAVQLTEWSDVRPISNLAEAIRLNGDLPLAAKVLQRGYMSLNSSDPSGLLAFEFGTVLEAMGNHSAAADWYLSAALADNSNTRAWLKASTLLFPYDRWDLSVAESVLATAVKAKADDPLLLFNLGVVLHYTNRISEASLLYSEALRLDPLLYAAMSNLATALHSLGRTGEAQGLYHRVYEATISDVPGEIINPFSATATTLGNYALLLSSMQRHQQAAAMALRAVQLDPESADLQRVRESCAATASTAAEEAERGRLAIVEAVTSGNWQRGLEVLAAVGVPAEDDAWWYFTKGMIHYFRGENELALQYCSVALDHSSNFVSLNWVSSPGESPARASHMIHGCLGVANQYLGRHEAAAASFAESLDTLRQMSPSSPSPVRVHVLPLVGFSMNEQDVIFNLLIALRNTGNYSECVAEGFRGMNVNPDVSEGAGLILMFSFVDWSASPALRDAVGSVERRELASGRLQLPEGASLLSEIERIQQRHIGILTPTFDCFDQLAENSKLVHSWRDHSSSLVTQATGGRAAESGDSAQRLVLITQYFHAQDQVARDALISVLSRNLRHADIAEVALVNAQEYDFAALQSAEKVKQYISGKRLTFADAFRVANNFYPNQRVIVSNSDIFFDETLKLALSASLNGTMIALSKWNAVTQTTADGATEERISLTLRVDSQDAWVFQTPIPDSIVAEADFFLGAPRCDNRIARLFAQAGYKVINPAFSLHAIEKSSMDVRRALQYGVENAVGGATALVLLSDASAL